MLPRLPERCNECSTARLMPDCHVHNVAAAAESVYSLKVFGRVTNPLADSGCQNPPVCKHGMYLVRAAYPASPDRPLDVRDHSAASKRLAGMRRSTGSEAWCLPAAERSFRSCDAAAGDTAAAVRDFGRISAAFGGGADVSSLKVDDFSACVTAQTVHSPNLPCYQYFRCVHAQKS